MAESRRVLVLTSDTGAGHRSVSNALIAQAKRRDGARLELVDLDPFLPLPAATGGPAEAGSVIDRLVPLYGPVIVRAPWLWGLAFYATNNAAMHQVYLSTFGLTVARRIAEAVQRIGACAVVSVHPLVNELMVRARAQLRRPGLPLMTIVTDLVDVHRWWAAPAVDQYVVASDAAEAALVRLGVTPSRIAQTGIPLREEFDHLALSAREARERLELDPDMTTVLVMGGGAGAGRLVNNATAIASAGAQAGLRFQMEVVTGSNRRAREALQRHAWPVPARVHGTVGDVATRMVAADVVVTKPGSLTVSEGLAVGRPLVLGRPLPGQEEGNIAYVVKQGAGLHYQQPREAGDAVAFLLKDPEVRWDMAQRALRLSRPRATERALDLLQALVLRAERDYP